MDKFLVLYLAPTHVLDDWMKTDEATRKREETRMQEEWKVWLEQQGDSVKETVGAGKTKQVTKEGVHDIRNNIMMYSIVEAESHDAAAHMFVEHIHLQIPEATIEIMKINPLSDMQ